MSLKIGRDRAPRGVVEALREIDEDADLVYLGEQKWLLGVRRPNPAAEKRLEEQLRHLDPHRGLSPEMAHEFELLQFYADEPFRPIHLYETDEPGWEIVEDFRMRDWNWRVRPAEAIREMKDEISIESRDERRNQRVREIIDAEGPGLFRHVFKRARGVLQRAFPGSDD